MTFDLRFLPIDKILLPSGSLSTGEGGGEAVVLFVFIFRVQRYYVSPIHEIPNIRHLHTKYMVFDMKYSNSEVYQPT